jgi:hypothetical protein
MQMMNKELQQWLSDNDKEQIAQKISTQKNKKKPTGMCQICGLKSATYVCLKCGRSVCHSCYFTLVGLCEKCLSKETVEQWKHKKPDWEKVLGVDWLD